MADKVVYNDPTANNFPNDYNVNDVDDRTVLRTTAIRHKMYGKHVREAMAQGLEINSVVSGHADKNADNALDIATDTQNRFNNEIAGSENVNEVIDARHSSVDNKDFTVLGDRLNNIERNTLDNLGIINFTFDDSYRENRLTKQVFDDYGLICDFAIITDKVNSEYNDYQGISWYLDAQNAGYGIQSHTRTHLDMTKSGLRNNLVYREIVTSKQILNQLGLSTSGLVAPRSVFNSEYDPLIKQNYDYAVSHPAVNNINAPMDRNVDRYHLQRMSLAATDIDVIKQAIDKTIDQKLLLMFYDHRTGHEDSATEEKLREVLDYVKTKVNAQQVRVLKSADAVADYFKVTQVLPHQTQAKAQELALPISRYLFNTDVDDTAWNFKTGDNPTVRYYTNGSFVYFTFSNNESITNAEMYQVVDVSKHANESQPHYLSVSAPMNAVASVYDNLTVQAFARYFDTNGNQLGTTEKQAFYIDGNKNVFSNSFSFPNNAVKVEIGYQFESDTTLSGNLNVFQPSILEDQVGYTGEFSDVYTPMQFGLTPTVGTPRSWSFGSLPSFTLGLARRYFTYDQTKNYITCLIAGTYKFRISAAYKVSSVTAWTNPRVLIELRINDDNPSHTNALYRAQSTRSVGDVFNIDSTMEVDLKVGDVIRFATDFDMLDTPTLDVIANSFVIVNRQI